MKILIKGIQRHLYDILEMAVANGNRDNLQVPESFQRKLDIIRGRWIEVATKYLYNNEFATVKIPLISTGGMRINNREVEDVIDDFRIGRSRCDWCAHHTKTGLPCHSCKRSSNLTEFFPGTVAPINLEFNAKSILATAFQGGVLD